MKKVLISVLLLCLLFACVGCGQTAAPQTADISLPDVMQKIRAEVELPEMLDLTAENLPDYFGIDMQELSDFAVCVNANGYEKEEVVLLRAASEADVQPICDALNTSLQNAAAEMQNYLPEQYALVQSSTVQTDGLYITLFISENSTQIREIWEGFLS